MAPRINVLQVIPTLDEGGAERTVVDISDALIEAEFGSYVATSGGRLTARLQAMGAQIFQLPVNSKNPLTIYQNISRLSDVAVDHGISIIHARSRAPAWSALFAARRAGCHFMTTHHGTFRDSGYVKSLYNSIMARGEVVIANSNFIAQRISEKYPNATGHTLTIARGVDLAEFDRSVVDATRVQAFRQRIKVDDDKRLVILPGRVTPWKGQDVFVDAAARIQAQSLEEKVCFVCVGEAEPNSDFGKALAEKIKDLGLDDCVRFSGHMDDMPAAYASAAVAVSASTEPEAFGRIAVEAQAMGCPIIATALGGSLETVIDGETGHLIPPNNANALAAAITDYLAMSNAERETMAAAARKNVVDHFSKQAMCDKTLAAYRTLAAQKTNRPNRQPA